MKEENIIAQQKKENDHKPSDNSSTDNSKE